MRIAHYYHWALAGEFGTGVAVRGWSAAMAASGDQVRLVAGGNEVVSPPAQVELMIMPNVPGDLPRPSMLRRAFRGADLVVLHGGWDPRNVVAAAVARRSRIPYVITAHGVYYPEVFRRRKAALKAFWWKAFEQQILDRALAIHVFYEPEVMHLRNRDVATPTVLAPNGFQAPPGIAWKPETDFGVVWLGRFDPEHKGLDLLLHAVSKVPKGQRPTLRLFGVDWHGQKASIVRLAEHLGVAGDVAIEPPVYGDEKWSLLAKAQGFVYPSRWDAAPMAVVEAGSIGVPLLVTRFPVASFLAERGAALQVDPTPEALAVGLRQLTKPSSADMGVRAARVVREDLSWERVCASWRAQVQSLLADGRRGS